jgi:sirohydrochlorin ferrochelatase
VILDPLRVHPEKKGATDMLQRQEIETIKACDVKSAVILLGHGSRVPDAGKHMHKVARGLQAKYGHEIVEVCYMSRLGPHLPETFEKCVGLGATTVLVIPYFLHDGLHLVLDIPEMMQEIAAKFPHVKSILGKNLGFDQVLVDLVERRITDSMDCCDVRDLELPPRKKYPVPLGQCEFVQMKPEEAECYMSNQPSAGKERGNDS